MDVPVEKILQLLGEQVVKSRLLEEQMQELVNELEKLSAEPSNGDVDNNA